MTSVGADCATLIARGRAPGSGGVHDRETTDGDEVDILVTGIDDAFPVIDLSDFLVGISTSKVCPDTGDIGRTIHFTVPGIRFFANFFFRLFLEEGFTVQIDIATMGPISTFQPVFARPSEFSFVRVIILERGIGQLDFPDVSIFDPALDLF